MVRFRSWTRSVAISRLVRNPRPKAVSLVQAARCRGARAALGRFTTFSFFALVTLKVFDLMTDFIGGSSFRVEEEEDALEGPSVDELVARLDGLLKLSSRFLATGGTFLGVERVLVSGQKMPNFPYSPVCFQCKSLPAVILGPLDHFMQ